MERITLITLFSVILLKLSAQNTFPTSGNAGIGTTTPSAPLTILQPYDGAGIRLQAPNGPESDNYLEMGTNATYPFIYSIWSNTRLDISGGYKLFMFANDIHFEGNTIIGRLGDPNSLATSKSSRTMLFEANVWNGTEGIKTYSGIQNIASTTTNSAHRLGFKVGALNTDFSDGIEVLSVCSDSSVGINTTDTKGYSLAVNGPAIFTKAVVRNYGNWTWPDYVFDAGYKLSPLSQLERFIKANKHLPDVPSAEQIEKDGLNLGATQAILLKKIEELTLYVIEQGKQLEEQRLLNLKLQKQVKLIEQQQKK